MKKIKKIIVILIGVMILLSGYLFVSPLKSETSGSINKKECSKVYVLKPNKTIKQSFKCQVDNLNKITFQSPYRYEGYQYHVLVKMENDVLIEQDVECKSANGITKIAFDTQKSLGKNISLFITNKTEEDISLPKEKNTKKTLDIKYYGKANNYFFAWYPVFVVAILFVVLSVME